MDGYTTNLSVQLLISYLKVFQIRDVVISPGTTNLEFVAGLQYDGFFNLFSSVDERSAAYIACGIATETNSPVVITCTEATASRNYYPGITEAFHRKLPIIAVTGVHRYSEIGHLHPQIINRDMSPSDTFVKKVHLPIIKDCEDEWSTRILINEALNAVVSECVGPVHIDLPCCNQHYDFSAKSLPVVNKIEKIYKTNQIPEIPKEKNIAIYIGTHNNMNKQLQDCIDIFCEQNDAVVICDYCSGYNGRYGVHINRLAVQKARIKLFDSIDLLIHIGEEPSDDATVARLQQVKEVWRINSDGIIRDLFKKVTKVFVMNEEAFFYGCKNNDKYINEQYDVWKKELSEINIEAEEIPFSNIYVASVLSKELPDNSRLFLGPSNTIRAWNLIEIPNNVKVYANMGCRGIDGVLSSAVGVSFMTDELVFVALGDLTFFYDLNAIGNRDIKNNLRIIIINNNGGAIFKQKTAPGYRFFGDDETNRYIAARGHFGNESRTFVKHIAEDLGYLYLSVSTKQELTNNIEHFVSRGEKPILLEVFTDEKLEREAFDICSSLKVDEVSKLKKFVKSIIK